MLKPLICVISIFSSGLKAVSANSPSTRSVRLTADGSDQRLRVECEESSPLCRLTWLTSPLTRRLLAAQLSSANSEYFIYSKGALSFVCVFLVSAIPPSPKSHSHKSAFLALHCFPAKPRRSEDVSSSAELTEIDDTGNEMTHVLPFKQSSRYLQFLND